MSAKITACHNQACIYPLCPLYQQKIVLLALRLWHELLIKFCLGVGVIILQLCYFAQITVDVVAWVSNKITYKLVVIIIYPSPVYQNIY